MKAKEPQPEPMRPQGHNLVTQGTGRQYKPEDLDPELANIAVAREVIKNLGTPAILKKEFIVRYGIYKALNHQEQMDIRRHTGYDSSLRLAVYEEVARQSVNVDGEYFTRIWQWLMKPKYIINTAGVSGAIPQEEEKQSIVGRMVGWFRGGKKNEPNSN